MLKLKDFSKVLVEYKRTPAKLTSYIEYEDGFPVAKLRYTKGNIKGVVVAIGPNIIGWSLCDKKDKFDIEFGINLALKRAKIAETLSFRNRGRFYSTIPTTMLEEFKRMDDRSEKYFTLPDNK